MGKVKIQEQIEALKSMGATLSVDQIFDLSTIRDIKEYILYLQKEVEWKTNQVKELVTENVTMEVKMESLTKELEKTKKKAKKIKEKS